MAQNMILMQTHWKIKSERAEIGIQQKMRIKNLRGSVRSDLKKLDSFTLEKFKNHLIHNFLRNERLRVNKWNCSYKILKVNSSQNQKNQLHSCLWDLKLSFGMIVHFYTCLSREGSFAHSPFFQTSFQEQNNAL